MNISRVRSFLCIFHQLCGPMIIFEKQLSLSSYFMFSVFLSPFFRSRISFFIWYICWISSPPRLFIMTRTFLFCLILLQLYIAFSILTCSSIGFFRNYCNWYSFSKFLMTSESPLFFIRWSFLLAALSSSVLSTPWPRHFYIFILITYKSLFLFLRCIWCCFWSSMIFSFLSYFSCHLMTACDIWCF